MSIIEDNKFLIVIAGPTAVGKTDVTLRLAQIFNAPIISADARQCYIEMNIGTAKPSVEELNQAHHYFINSHHVSENISAADYERLSLGYLEEIYKEKDIAILSGGTGLYIKSVLEGLDEMPEIDTMIDQQINSDFNKKGLKWLQDYVQKEDPEFYQQSEKENPHRLIRALVFKLSTGFSILKYRSGKKQNRDFTPILIGLELDREILYKRINKRVDKMIADGLIEEANALFSYRNLKNLQTVGYQEFYGSEEFPKDKTSIAGAVEKIKQHTRNYAKRQMTYFKRQLEMKWFDPNDFNQIVQYIYSQII